MSGAPPDSGQPGPRIVVAEARRFLDLLGGPDELFSFQTLDDDVARREKRAADARAAGEAEYVRMLALGHTETVAKRGAAKVRTKTGRDDLAAIFHGKLEQHATRFARLNAQRAGIFVTVNQTDLQGRNADNVVRVRAIFADLDGVDLGEARAKLAKIGLVPHIVVQSSPGRWHLYLKVVGFPLARFTEMQQRVIKLLGSDPAVHDLPRVMRLPGFLHQKGEPVLVACTDMIGDHEAYGPEAFERLPPIDQRATREQVSSNDDPLTDAVERLGLVVGDGAKGGYDITCPWEGEHSTLSAPSSTTYWPARGSKPGFKCHHAHCAQRTVKDFIAELRRRDPALDRYYKAKAKFNGHGQTPPPNHDSEPEAEPSPSSDTPDEATTAAEIIRLAKLSVIAYQRERADSAKALKLPVGALDRFVALKRKELTNGHPLPEIEPWHQPVDGAKLLDDLAAAFKRHVGLPTRGEDAVALWTLHAHCHDAATTSPRLAIRSATPECGKSTLLRLVGDLVPRKLAASNITAAATFRAIEKWYPTLLIDEADTFLRDNDELRGVLNSGHSRSEAFVVRTTGDDHEPTLFGTWCPVVIAMIGHMPATLASRAVHIELQRLSKGERVEPYRQGGRYADLARKCARWAADNVEALRDAEPDLEGIANRAADNWRLLAAIADRAGGHWGGPTGRAREAALTLTPADAGQTVAIMLLADIRSILVERGEDDRISSAELAQKLGEMEGRPWPEFGRSGKAITTHGLARLLKPFHVTPTKIHFPDRGESVQGYWVSALQALFDRWLPSY